MRPGPSVLRFLLGVAGLLLLVAGFSMSCDRRGLRAEYWANTADWAGLPVFERVERSVPMTPKRVGAVVRARVFSVRWQGWLWIERAGRHAFLIRTAGNGRLSVDGERVVAAGGAGDPVRRGSMQLGSGLHSVEIDFSRQVWQPDTLRLLWKPPGGQRAAIPPEVLFPDRPSALRLTLRRLSARLSPAWARAWASSTLLVGLLVLSGALGSRSGDSELVRERARRWARPRIRLLEAAFFAAVFVVALLASLPFTGGLYGFDDVRYLDVATFPRPLAWIVNRYAHIYLVKATVGLAGGDAFAGARLYWSSMFAVTLVAMAVAVRSLGRRLQLGTLAIAILLLLAQPVLFERIGAAYADYSAMMWVAVGVAIYLHGLARPGTGPGRWHALGIGLVTIWATKSKELGAVLLWLLPLLALERGRLSWSRLLRRSGSWMGGAALGLIALVGLDAIHLGDPLFGLRPSNQESARNFNFSASPQEPRRGRGWMEVIWAGHERMNPDDPSAGLLGVMVLAAAWVASWKGRRLELRLLHLMPIAYFVALVTVQARGTYVHLPRYLFPIVPVACVLAAALFHDLGLDDLDWARLARRPVLLALVFGLAAALLQFLLPVLVGRPGAEALLPLAWLARAGWTAPGDFVASTLAPVALLGALAALALCARHAVARLLLLFAVTSMLFAPSLQRTLDQLATRQAVQRTDNYLYPLRAFARALPSQAGQRLLVSHSLVEDFRMCGPRLTCPNIAKIFCRGDVEVRYATGPPDPEAFLLATGAELDRWRQTQPDLGQRTRMDPSGLVGLIRPDSLEYLSGD